MFTIAKVPFCSLVLATVLVANQVFGSELPLLALHGAPIPSLPPLIRRPASSSSILTKPSPSSGVVVPSAQPQLPPLSPSVPPPAPLPVLPPSRPTDPILPPRPPQIAIIEQPPIADRLLLKGIRNVRVIYDEEFQMRCLDAINRKRLWHENTPPLVIGDNFTQYTVDRAWSILNDISDGKREIRKGEYPFGESFFWYYDPHRYRTVEDAVNTWYEESRHYDYNKPEFSARTGGFTQMIWRSSREATCVKIEYETPKSFKTLVVANFWPAGNVKGEFAQNVLPLRQTRPDLIEPNRPMQRPWPRPPYRPPHSETYPTHPILNHVAGIAVKPVQNMMIEPHTGQLVQFDPLQASLFNFGQAAPMIIDPLG